jgi:hypothetical protein
LVAARCFDIVAASEDRHTAQEFRAKIWAAEKQRIEARVIETFPEVSSELRISPLRLPPVGGLSLGAIAVAAHRNLMLPSK